jgi:hypothetical protein
MQLSTVKRPDVAEQLKDYGFARAGFRLKLSVGDGTPIRAEEIALVAQNTVQGVALLKGCGCQ